ncbi:MAG: hypothetical protein LBF84_03465 [Holosporales bacterium]|nr:hypothetical protein [Holosporales bacterium]
MFKKVFLLGTAICWGSSFHASFAASRSLQEWGADVSAGIAFGVMPTILWHMAAGAKDYRIMSCIAGFEMQRRAQDLFGQLTASLMEKMGVGQFGDWVSYVLPIFGTGMGALLLSKDACWTKLASALFITKHIVTAYSMINKTDFSDSADYVVYVGAIASYIFSLNPALLIAGISYAATFFALDRSLRATCIAAIVGLTTFLGIKLIEPRAQNP